MSATEDRGRAEANDRANVALFRAEKDNRQTLVMLLTERRGRFDPEVRAEIGQRYLADLANRATADHPGFTRRERLFPNAPPIDPRPGKRPEIEAAYLAAGIAPAVSAFLAGTSDACSLSDYRAALGPIVRRVRERIFGGGDGPGIIRDFEPLWNAYWLRAFDRDLTEAAGLVPRSEEAPPIEAQEL